MSPAAPPAMPRYPEGIIPMNLGHTPPADAGIDGAPAVTRQSYRDAMSPPLSG